MSLFEKIKHDQLAARKVKNVVATDLLTTLLGESRAVAKNALRDLPTDSEIGALIKKFLDGNAATQEALQRARATDATLERLAVAIEEQKILEGFKSLLPKQLTEDELKTIVHEAIVNGAKEDMGALMGVLKKGYEGRYDGKLASAVVRAALAK